MGAKSSPIVPFALRPTRSSADVSEASTTAAAIADFSDPESQRVLDAVADVLIAPAIRQKARDDFEAWLASQQVHR